MSAAFGAATRKASAQADPARVVHGRHEAHEGAFAQSEADTSAFGPPPLTPRYLAQLIPQKADSLPIQRRADTSLSEVPGFVQAKLVVGSSHDPLEHEADAIADRVMARPADVVQRKCASCVAEDEKETETIRRSSASPSVSATAPSPLIGDVLQSSGTALDGTTREFMESRFNHDFSGVRVHAGSKAAESARQINARAYTVGKDVVFGDGQYAPSTASGRHMLAHELAHTVQQGAGRTGIVQRAEVDDTPGCDDLDDSTSFINSTINKVIAAARAAHAGPIVDPADRAKFVTDVNKRLRDFEFVKAETGPDFYNNIEHWMYWHADSDKRGQGTKYKGKSTPADQFGAVLNVSGDCIGTDKIGHFFLDGFEDFRKGLTETGALISSYDAEMGVQGLDNSGVFSNADIHVNLAGRKFYQELLADPFKSFKIEEFVGPTWNERNVNNFYRADVGKLVWKNLLEGNWKGWLTFSGGRIFDVRMKITDADTSARTVKGKYEETLPSWWTWDDGEFTGTIEFRSTSVQGSSAPKLAVAGVDLKKITLTMDAGPVWNGELKSVNENTLSGQLTSAADSSTGQWYMQR